MPSFFLAFVAAAAATFAGREAVRVARLSAALGAGAGLLVACWLACALAGGLAAWLGWRIGTQMAPDAKAVFIASALLLAAAELAVLRPGRVPQEPTRSFGAITIVVGISQLTVAASFLVLGLAAAAKVPEPVALGGALGSGAALTAAWYAGREWEARLPSGALRWGVVGLLLLAAGATVLSARGLAV